MDFDRVKAYANGIVNVIIETPKGSPNKYNYDPELKLFKLKKTLPLGMVFPFDFGFVPNTIGGDGDPLDVLVLMDAPACMGCLVECRLVGVLLANQKEKGSPKVRNDRILAVSTSSLLFGHIKELRILKKELPRSIENFFIDYNNRQNKVFTPIKWMNAVAALKLVKKNLVSKEK